MRLMPRDLRVIADVIDWEVLSREQLQHLGHFGSKTRANAVLLRLVKFNYLSRRYLPAVAGTQHALYFGGPSAADTPNRPSDVLRRHRHRIKGLSDLFLAHQLLVNDVRIQFHRATTVTPTRWETDRRVRAMSLGVIADGYIEFGEAHKRFAAFVEVDRGTETLERWTDKVRAYLRLALSGQHRQALGRQFFRVLTICPSDIRLEHLRRATAKLTDRIFWFADLPRVRREGPYARVWLRPLGSDRHELTEP